MAAVLEFPRPPHAASDPTAVLCTRLRISLQRFFASYRLTPHDVEDLIQDVFLRLAVPAVRPPLRNPDAFVFTVARNLVRDRARRLHTRAAAASVGLEDVELACGRPTPDELLAQRERLDRASNTLDSLKSKTREAFLRLRLDGCSYADIAAELGVSVSMVEKHVMVAASALRKGDT
jgi:RNA polymerase sigma factor (sigma-70 family)